MLKSYMDISACTYITKNLTPIYLTTQRYKSSPCDHIKERKQASSTFEIKYDDFSKQRITTGAKGN